MYKRDEKVIIEIDGVGIRFIVANIPMDKNKKMRIYQPHEEKVTLFEPEQILGYDFNYDEEGWFWDTDKTSPKIKGKFIGFSMETKTYCVHVGDDIEWFDYSEPIEK